MAETVSVWWDTEKERLRIKNTAGEVLELTHCEGVNLFRILAKSIFASLLSFILLGSLVGVREGTVFAALFTGTFTRYITKFMRRKGFYEWAGHREFSYEIDKKKTSES